MPLSAELISLAVRILPIKYFEFALFLQEFRIARKPIKIVGLFMQIFA
jgi:hypothetical protein